jgi:hypothetical protein
MRGIQCNVECVEAEKREKEEKMWSTSGHYV